MFLSVTFGIRWLLGPRALIYKWSYLTTLTVAKNRAGGRWMSMERWWNGTDRGKLNCTGRETLYRVGGRWMDGYGAMVEWY